MHTVLWKRGAVAIGGAVLLLTATLGFSHAQTQPTTTDKKQQHEAVLNLAAAKLGLTGDQLATALKDARKDLGQKPQNARAVHAVRQELSVAATALGIADVKTLSKELRGSTLTAVAQAHKVSPATVAAAMKADVDARIQALVTDGKLKADRAATLKVKAEAKIDAFMTRQFKAGRAGA